LTWDEVREIRRRAKAGVPQSEIAIAFKISRPLCNEIVHLKIWDPDAKLTIGDEMRDRIIGALDTALPARRDDEDPEQARRLAQRWIRIPKEHSKTEVARVIPFERVAGLKSCCGGGRSWDRTRSRSATLRPAPTSRT